ncbi:Uncharacterised protein g4051 [Pycnogonum litorale]
MVMNSIQPPCKDVSLNGALKFDTTTIYATVASTPGELIVKTFKFSAYIKTFSQSGTILSMLGSSEKKMDYMIIALRSGKLQLAYDKSTNGNEPSYCNMPGGRINDGKWHHIVIERNIFFTYCRLKLHIDGNVVTCGNGFDSYGLKTDGLLRLGKVTTEDVPKSLSTVQHFTQGFVGHIKKVKFNDEDVALNVLKKC